MDKYICKIDDAEFTSETDLIEYLKSKYVNVVNTDVKSNGLSCENIYKEFRKNLPNYVDIRVMIDTEDGGFLVDINSEVCDFTCQIGAGEWNYYHIRFTNVESAIEHYQNFFNYSDEIIRKVKEKYEIQLEVTQMFEASSEGEYSISFSFYLNEQDHTETYEFGDIDLFVKNLEQYVSRVLEGRLVMTRKEYDTEFTIDGISIEGFANRSKRVRLEIIE